MYSTYIHTSNTHIHHIHTYTIHIHIQTPHIDTCSPHTHMYSTYTHTSYTHTLSNIHTYTLYTHICHIHTHPDLTYMQAYIACTMYSTYPHSSHIHTHKHAYTALALETANQGKASPAPSCSVSLLPSTAHHCRGSTVCPPPLPTALPPHSLPAVPPSLSPAEQLFYLRKLSLTHPTLSCQVPVTTWLFCTSTEGIICTCTLYG